jgi:hypothetical protein
VEPIKTLDLPVAGHGYNTLSFVFDLVQRTNVVKAAARTKDPDSGGFPEDADGTKTLEYLRNVQGVIARITGTGPQAIGPHPAVYFYTLGGAFQPAALLATAELLLRLEKEGKLIEFTRVRRSFEEFLIACKDFISSIVHKYGSGIRSVTPLHDFFSIVLDSLWAGKTPAGAINDLDKSPFKFVFLSEPFDTSEAKSGKFSRNTKSAAFLRDALAKPIRCSVCGAMVHSKSMHIDHEIPRREGGLAKLENAKITHPYCDSTAKDELAKRS